MPAMQDHFYALADFAQSQLQEGEQYTCWLSAEETDFIRFNHGLIRQSGNVQQAYLAFTLVQGTCHVSCSLSLSADLERDQATLQAQLHNLREELRQVPPDPHFIMAQEVNTSVHIRADLLVPAQSMVDDILRTVQGLDFVGYLASGPMYRGFANSYGQRNWHQMSSFNLDFSLYHSADKAVKSAYAGFEWDAVAFAAKIADAGAKLEILKQPAISVPPGAYRAYLSPAAMYEIITMLNWDGVGEKSLRSKQSSLRRMRDEGLQLHAAVNLVENTAGGLSPAFQEDGFIKPQRVELIQDGKLCGSMIAPRTAMEYGLQNNGAGDDEAMEAAYMTGGDLPEAEVLQTLGTGIYIGNLWYLNFSDRSACRMTGMTRFASFWVEDGKIKAPLNVMRFDDSLFSLFGENLLAITRETEIIIDSDTYEQRGDRCASLPGVLVKDFQFVL